VSLLGNFFSKKRRFFGTTEHYSKGKNLGDLFMLLKPKAAIHHSNYISRDLSWIKFNFRVLDQSKKPSRTIFERLKFLAITASNLDEFFQIRVGSLYNYLDYSKERFDFSGLREVPFRKRLLKEIQVFHKEQENCFINYLEPEFEQNGFLIADLESLNDEEQKKAEEYFIDTLFPMLTPMVYDSYHSFPMLMNKLLIFGVITNLPEAEKDSRRLSFVQIPQNLPRFFEIQRGDLRLFVPIEQIIRWKINELYRNVEILSVNLFRIIRNADFSLEETEETDVKFVEEVRRKLKSRKSGRVVRVEIEDNYSNYMMKILLERWGIDQHNVFISKRLCDFTALWQIIKNKEFRSAIPSPPDPVKPLVFPVSEEENMFTFLKHNDILLHQPYNKIDPVMDLLDKAANDPQVLAIKITIYRLAKDSRVTAALYKAAENGKHVSVLFEVKARFDEENNINEALKLQKAGCFVIFGIGNLKTHTKLLMIVRKESDKVRRYVHMSSGNYNEDTARLYTDISLLTSNEVYATDINEFFNVITGHSMPRVYTNLITAPGDMRYQLIELIENEAENALAGKSSGIVIKLNSLQDKEVIDAFYKASQAGVPIKLIVRGICCLKAGRVGLSENISVHSIVGDFLEHSRIFYFHNAGNSKVYGGSADMMMRSFDRRIEALFLIQDPLLKQQVINILFYNLKDNVNRYLMGEDGNYAIVRPKEGEAVFNIHKEFFNLTKEKVLQAKLF
jgi:polyphosphate kinase